MTQTSRKIGFIGLGNQGAPIAMRLLKADHLLTVFDASDDALKPFAAAGARIAGSAAEVGAVCDFVGICVVDDAQVKEVVDALLTTMAPGGIIAVHSTVLPETCRTLAREAARQDVTLIDTPVIGGAARAEIGELIVMIGGDAASVEICRPIFAAFAKSVPHLGPVGSGQLCKAINNALVAAHFSLAHEAFETGRALGLDHATLVDVLTHGTGTSFSLTIMATLPSIKTFEHGARLLKKDVGVLAQSCDAPEAKAIIEVADRLQHYVWD